jgi:hypothetical protein
MLDGEWGRVGMTGTNLPSTLGLMACINQSNCSNRGNPGQQVGSQCCRKWAELLFFRLAGRQLDFDIAFSKSLRGTTLGSVISDDDGQYE